MDKTEEYYAKSNKQDPERQIPYAITLMWILQTHSNNHMVFARIWSTEEIGKC